MKLLLSEVQDFLKSIGADVEIVDDGSEFDKDSLLTAVDSNRKEILKPLILDEETETIRKEVSGRYGGTLRSQLARISGMKRVDLDKFVTDEEAIKAAWDHSSGMLEGEKADFKRQIDEILTTHKNETDSLKSEYEGKVSAANQKYIDRDIKEFIVSQLKDAPIPKNADRSILAEDFKNYLQNKYHLNYNEATKAVELALKDNPNMPAMNTAKTAHIKILDEAKEFLSPRALWEMDMSGRNPANEMSQAATATTTKKPQATNSIQDKKSNFMNDIKANLESQQA